MNLGTAQIIQGNALELPLPDASVDLICTSPPYFGLRSYQDTQLCDRCKDLIGQGWEYYRPNDRSRNLREAWPDWDAHVTEFHKPVHYDGQIGSEATPTEFLDALLAATREMVRVLKPSGSLFVNLGDKYAGTPGRDVSRASQFPTADGQRPSARHRTRPEFELGDTSRPVTFGGVPGKSLMGIPWRYAIRCIDELGLILRAEIIWSKPNGLPESVTDRVRRSHEQWFHMVKQPRYFAAVDEIRVPQMHPNGTQAAGYSLRKRQETGEGRSLPYQYDAPNPLGKLPGSVWEIPSQPLTVPPELGVDHFAAYPMEWPRRIIQGWTPNGICTACGEGRRPATSSENIARAQRSAESQAFAAEGSAQGRSKFTADVRWMGERQATITGYVCACPTPDAPTTPAICLDPFGGTGTTALVAKALGRTGISIDLSNDYCRLAEWRVNDPRELAAALQVEKPEPVHPDQLDLFEGLT